MAALALVATLVPTLLATATASPASASPVGTVTTVAAGIFEPVHITSGPDGNLWFTEFDAIGKITPTGEVTIHRDPSIRLPGGITAGPDGNLWFTNILGNTIGRITPTGTITTFPSGGFTPSGGEPWGITAGPDGNLWFTDYLSGTIGRMTPAGTITHFGAGLDFPKVITVGPDGNLWFANDFGSIAKMTLAGAVTTYANPGQPTVVAISPGPDGNVWFTNGAYLGPDSVRRITPAGIITTFIDPAIGDPRGITAGPDGNLWFSILGNNTIGRITPEGAVTTFPVPPGGEGPMGITSGVDGDLWFANTSGSVGRMTTTGVGTTLGNDIDRPSAMVTGPDGNVWFTNAGQTLSGVPGGSVGRITPAGIVTAATDPAISAPSAITVGPDGNLWFTNSSNPSIGRITPSGDLSFFGGAGEVASPRDITTGPDGNLWFTNSLGDSIGRITPAGVITTFTADSVHNPDRIAAGPDGNLWFTNEGESTLNRITPGGEISVRTDAEIATPRDVATGPDGALWFTNADATIGRMSADGTITTFWGNGEEISAGPDGNMWFAADHSIGRISSTGEVTIFSTPMDTGGVRAITAGPDNDVWFSTYVNSIMRITAIGEPGPPTGVTAVAGSASADVSWSPPASDGASPVTGYTVTASPGGATCSWTAGPLSCTVTGLDDGTAYTFTVTATNAVGTGPPSTPSNAVTPAAGTFFHPLAPTRVLDSRTNLGGWNTTALAAGTPRALTVTGGTTGVPADATAVVLNLTATASTADTYLTAHPTGTAPPTASNLNVAAGQTIANLATTKIGDNGTITLTTNTGTVDVIADVAGYYSPTPGDRYTPLDPTRLLDSRTNVGGWSSTPLTAATPRTLTVAGATTAVPSTASAVVLNLTATASTANTYLTASPTGAPTPTASTLNAAAGQTIANLATVKIGDNGTITLTTNTGSVDVIADIAGYYDPSTGDLFHPLDPTRILDSRTTNGAWNAPLTAGTPRTLHVTNNGGVPAGATAIIANTTVTAATADSYLTLSPTGTPSPPESNLNYAAGQTIPNLTATKIGTNGQITFSTHTGSTHVLYDLAGYFAPT